ncbi:hypothetical protein SDC9_182097 [bioreactor metagenome]|uniref:Uncharacterized protein n=1 Tax=bioreactor metagenome TaxID=1076179 RepID=A0A645HG09_9ZZZZ
MVRNLGEQAGFVEFLGHELLVEQPVAPESVFVHGFVHVLMLPDQCAFDHHRKEHALLAAGGDHAVKTAGVIIDAVPGAEYLDLVFELALELPFQYVVEFLPGVAGEVYRGGVVGERRPHHEWLGTAVFHPGGLMQIFEPGAALDRSAFAGAYESIAGKCRRFAGDERADVNIEPLGAAKQESERAVQFAGLVLEVFFH